MRELSSAEQSLLSGYSHEVRTGEKRGVKPEKAPAIDPVTGVVRRDLAEKVIKTVEGKTLKSLNRSKSAGDPYGYNVNLHAPKEGVIEH